jgi:hypothetical protein
MGAGTVGAEEWGIEYDGSKLAAHDGTFGKSRNCSGTVSLFALINGGMLSIDINSLGERTAAGH